FKIAAYHPKVRLNGLIVDEVADLQADLSAAGGEVGHLEAKLVDGAVDRGANRAALGGDRDRAFRKLLQGLVRDAAEAGLAAGDAHAVRANDGEVGLVEHRAQVGRETAPLLVAAFPEARRIERAAPGTGLGAVAQTTQRGLGRREQDEVIRRLRQGVERGKA